jgi:hypothetical protein
MRSVRGGYGLVLLGLAALICLGVIATRPQVASHFGYALPVANGLPCRLHYRGRDYENDSQCVGMNQSAWSERYTARHHLSSGGVCLQPAALRQAQDWPLEQVASIWTLFGPAHPVLVSHRDDAAHGFATMGVYVMDGSCYRPYELLGGP